MPALPEPVSEGDALQAERPAQRRIDPPHELAGDISAASDPAAERLSDVSSEAIRWASSAAPRHAPQATASAGDSATAVATRPATEVDGDSVSLQVEQLAQRLSAQLRDLDRREAALHAQLAEQENASRSARHWFRERQHELTQQEADLKHREEALELKSAELARDEAQQAEARERAKADQRRLSESFANRQRELDAREQAITARETKLAERAAEVEAVVAKLVERQQVLEEAEALLADGQNGLREQRQRMVTECDAWRQKLRTEQQRLEAEQARALLDIEQKSRFLVARAELLDRRSAALDALRDEVAKSHRETLELRLATDELWAELCGQSPPAELAQSLTRIRGQVADAARDERRQVDALRQELEQATARLAEDRQIVQRQQEQIEAWQAECRAQFDKHAEQLVSQERMVEEREQSLADARRQLDEERDAYEREIRRLLGQLRAAG